MKIQVRLLIAAAALSLAVGWAGLRLGNAALTERIVRTETSR